jgi:hypothetical protein
MELSKRIFGFEFNIYEVVVITKRELENAWLRMSYPASSVISQG